MLREPDPIASYLNPNTLPTQEQCKSLAVLLSLASLLTVSRIVIFRPELPEH